MTYLTKDDYFHIISTSLLPIHFKIEYYLLFQYRLHKKDNPEFLENIALAIKNIEDSIKLHFEFESSYPIDYKWEYHLFYFEKKQIRVLSYDYNISESSLDNIIANAYRDYCPISFLEFSQSYQIFLQKATQENGNIETGINDTLLIKLKWKGAKNQFYSVLRQLKIKYELLDNTFDELAEFLKQNVVGFESTRMSTIIKELKKDTEKPENLAKNKRIPINPDEDI
jgi:hypothetical protein